MDEKIWNDFHSLPADAQRQVSDFIAFLRRRHQQPSRSRMRGGLADEPFVGMWRDRDDMADSAAWVRRIREGEWAEPRG